MRVVYTVAKNDFFLENLTCVMGAVSVIQEKFHQTLTRLMGSVLGGDERKPDQMLGIGRMGYFLIFT